MSEDGGSGHPRAVLISSADVLSGRYNYSFNHPGNNYFRDLIQDNREAYQSAPRRAVKNRITNTVIRLVRDEPRSGRFLKLNGSNQWEVMTDEDVYEKVSHALRGAKKKTGLPRKKRAPASASGAAAEGGGPPRGPDGAVEGGAASAGSNGSGSTPQALASPFVSRAYEDVMARQRAIFDRLMRGAAEKRSTAPAPASAATNGEGAERHQPPNHRQRQEQQHLDPSSSGSYEEEEEEAGEDDGGDGWHHDRRQRVSAESGDDGDRSLCSSSSSTGSGSYGTDGDHGDESGSAVR
jgi:hypothetical protein